MPAARASLVFLLRTRSSKDEVFFVRSLCGEFFFSIETFRQLKKSFSADLHVDMMGRDSDGQISEIGIDLDGDALTRWLTIPKEPLNN